MTKNGKISIVCMNRLRDMLSFYVSLNCYINLYNRAFYYVKNGEGLYKCPIYIYAIFDKLKQ